MKKIIAFLLTVILVVSLISCSGGNENAPSEDTDSPAASDTSSVDTSENAPDTSESKLESITEFPFLNGAGMGYIGAHELLHYNLISSNDGLEDSYPVFRDAYPVSTTGPAYDPTDEELKIAENKLRDLLCLIYGEEIASNIEIGLRQNKDYEVEEYKLPCANYENTEIVYDVSGYVCITVNGTLIDEELIKSSPASNQYIKTALDYVGIKDPLVIAGDQTMAVYDIYDKASLESSERKFDFIPYVRVGVYSTSSSSCSAISIYNSENIFELEPTSYPTVSYTDALEYVKTEYPDIDMSTLSCRARYDNEACIGYYVPIYEFIFKDNNVSDDYYHDVKISAVEFTPEVELH